MRKPEKGSRMLRKGRASVGGAVYFLSTFKADVMGRLDREECFGAMMETLERLEAEGMAEWRAVVVMPDHVHMIARLGEGVRLSGMMDRLKGAAAHEINVRLGRKGAVWYKGFHDRMVRDGEEIEGYLNYLVQNPVKKGLVLEEGEWKYTRVKSELMALVKK